MAGADDDGFNVLLRRHQSSPQTPAARAEAGVGAHSIVYNTPRETGLEAWRRPAHRFDPAPSQANRNLTSRILKPPQDNVENISFIIEKWEEMVKRRDGGTGRQALIGDTIPTMMMDMGPAELENCTILSSDRVDTYPKAKAAIRDSVEQTPQAGPNGA